jgi:hypothetical protein
MTQEQISRRTRDLCQDCWQDANPTEYAPVATRYGPCAECGAEALIVRSRSLTPDDCPGGRCYGHHAEPTR